MAAIGTTRSLTAAFIRHRNEAKRVRGPAPDAFGGAGGGDEDRATAKLLGAALGAGSSSSGGAGAPGDIELGAAPGGPPPPSWVARSERIRAEMASLKERLGRLKEAHARALLVTFDAENAASSRVDALTREVQAGFKRLDGEVRAMGAAAGADTAAGSDDADVRLQVQRQLAQALFKLSVEFRKEETRFLNKVEAQRGLAAGSSIGLIEEQEGLGGTGGGLPGDPGFTSAQLMKVSQAEVLAQERDEEIRRIVETITELGQIMRDLSTLIVEQGTMLDRIDANVTQTAMKVEDGLTQLRRAEQTQRGGRAALCIMALCVLIAVMLVVIIIRHTL